MPKIRLGAFAIDQKGLERLSMSPSCIYFNLRRCLSWHVPSHRKPSIAICRNRGLKLEVKLCHFETRWDLSLTVRFTDVPV